MLSIPSVQLSSQKTSPDIPSKFRVFGRWLWSRPSIPQWLETIAGCIGTFDILELQTDSASWKSLESLIEFILSSNCCISAVSWVTAFWHPRNSSGESPVISQFSVFFNSSISCKACRRASWFILSLHRNSARSCSRSCRANSNFCFLLDISEHWEWNWSLRSCIDDSPVQLSSPAEAARILPLRVYGSSPLQEEFSYDILLQRALIKLLVLLEVIDLPELKKKLVRFWAFITLRFAARISLLWKQCDRSPGAPVWEPPHWVTNIWSKRWWVLSRILSSRVINFWLVCTCFSLLTEQWWSQHT